MNVSTTKHTLARNGKPRSQKSGKRNRKVARGARPRMGAQSVLSKTQRARPSRKRGAGAAGKHRSTLVATNAILAPRTVVQGRTGPGSRSTVVEYVAYIPLDVVSDATKSITVSTPDAGTLSTGATNSFVLGPWLYPKHAQMAGIYQQVTVNHITIEYQPLVGTNVPGIVCGALIKEYDKASFVPALPGVAISAYARLQGAKEFSPWQTARWDWAPTDPIERAFQFAKVTEADSVSLRSDGKQYLFVLAGQELTANTTLGKLRVGIHMTYKGTE